MSCAILSIDNRSSVITSNDQPVNESLRACGVLPPIVQMARVNIGDPAGIV